MIAQRFATAGARVYIAVRDRGSCGAAAARLSEVGWCQALPADLSDPTEIHHLAATVRDREESLHVLVNNAGDPWGAPLEQYPRTGWDKVLDLNVKAVFDLTVGVLPLLRAAAGSDDPARVINVGSADGIRPSATESYPYSAVRQRYTC
jgi:NAD(P)-dependent dehydrogenase (short-subunit alcohol dehydrogenase family)